MPLVRTKRSVPARRGSSQKPISAERAAASGEANTDSRESRTLCTCRFFRAAETITASLCVRTSTAISPDCNGQPLKFRRPPAASLSAWAISSAQ
ncbi:hypothetical protein ACFX50_04515 [Neisseria meningitidis]